MTARHPFRLVAALAGAALAASLAATGPSASAAGRAAPEPPAGPAPSAADRSPCGLLSRGAVPGVRGRPGHVLLALADRYGTSDVHVTSCRRAHGRYVTDFSSAGHVGTKGFAPPGEKREGDGRSPTGVFRLGTAFGSHDPGSRVGYLRLHPDSCWGSTVGSRHYNRYFRGACGTDDESMYDDVTGAYRQGMVIEYNTSPVRDGLGSAIFLHVSTGGSTAGCVSIPLPLVTSTIRHARRGDVIVMGVASRVLSR